MTTETMVTVKLPAWLADLNNTVAIVNSRHTDGITLMMPRAKDMVITYPEDAEAGPEQCPAIILEIGRFRWDPVNVAQFKGAIDARLHLCDDAESGAIARTKMVRWIDTLILHCKRSTSILGDNSRVLPRTMEVSMAKTKGDMNAIEIDMDIAIPLSVP